MSTLVRTHASEEDEIVAPRLATKRVQREVERVRAVGDPRERGPRRALVERDGDQIRTRGKREDVVVERAWQAVERSMDRVAERHVEQSAQREPEQAGVIVHDVELARPAEGKDHVPKLPERMTDPLARGSREHGVQPRARLRLARGEERHVVPVGDEPVREQRDDALDASVRLGRDRKPHWTDEPDFHFCLLEAAGWKLRPLGDCHGPPLHRDAPASPERAYALDAKPVEPTREVVLDGRHQPLPRSVG